MKTFPEEFFFLFFNFFFKFLNLFFGIIREFTVEKSLTCAVNVGRPIAEAPILFGPRKLTLEKDGMNATVLVTL